jgi:hypothetical protein
MWLLRRFDLAKIFSSWQQIKVMIFMCGPDQYEAVGPGLIRAPICDPNHSSSKLR